MADPPDEELSFPVADLLDSLEPARRDRVEWMGAGAPMAAADSGRAATPKEVAALHDTRKAGRLRMLLLRRTTDDGRLVYGRRRRALDAKRALAARGADFGPAAPGANWLSVGPRNINGRVKCLAVHPIDGSVLYAGSANGGVWKTTDGGRSWHPTMHDEDSLAIGAVAVDPGNPDTVYAGTGEPVYLVRGTGPLPPGSTNLGWYYPGVGVYRSTDGGASWALTGPIENDFVFAIAIDPHDSDRLLCAGYSLRVGAGGLCRSTDGGQTWTTIEPGVFTDVVFDPAAPGVAYAGAYNRGVLKTADGGQSWAARNVGLPGVGQIGRVNLSLARSNPGVLYAKLENDATGGLLGLYRTANGAEPPGGWSQVGNPGVDGEFAWWCSYVAADPTDPDGDVVWAGGLNVARSGDGGASWELLTDAYNGTRPPTHADQHALVFDPADPNVVYIANDGGVFRGTHAGGLPPATWTKMSYGLTITQFYDVHASPAAPSMFGGGAQDNGSMVTVGGLSWRSVYGGDGGYVAFHPSDPYTMYVQFQGAQIQRSTDGGNTFTSARSGISGTGTFPATVLAIDPSDPLKLFSGTDRVYRTLTGGVGAGAWSAVTGEIGMVTHLGVAPSDAAVVYAGTVRGRLFRSDDGGSGFTEITPAVAGWPRRWLSDVAVVPDDPDVVYVTFLGYNASPAGASDHVWRGTRDAATGVWAWERRAGDLPDAPVGALAIDPLTSHLFVATDVGVFRSATAGTGWFPFESNLPNTAVVDLALDPTRRLLRAATHGRGMYEIRLDGPHPEVELYVRDNPLDTGGPLPALTGVPDPTRPGAAVGPNESPDIKVVAAPALGDVVDGVQFDDPTHPYIGFGNPIEDIPGVRDERPVRGQVNRVYVQVHNRGWASAAQVTVKLLWAEAPVAPPLLPTDFWAAFPGDGFDQTLWRPVDTWVTTDLRPTTPRVLSAEWQLGPAADRVCLLLLVHSPQDPLVPNGQQSIDVLTAGTRLAAQRFVRPV